MTQIENRWTVGNIAALAGVGLSIVINAAVVIWWAAGVNANLTNLSARMESQANDTDKRFEVQANDSRRQLDLQSTMLGNYDVRLRDVERAYARLDEKVSTILETVREVRDVVKVQPNPVTAPRVSTRVDIRKYMSHETMADLPMPWPDATADRNTSMSSPSSRKMTLFLMCRPMSSSNSRCQGSGPVLFAKGFSDPSASSGSPQGNTAMTNP